MGGVVSAAWPATFNYCPFWPVRAVEKYQGPFNKKLANKALVASNLVRAFPEISAHITLPDGKIEYTQLDPATPLKGAQALIELLGDRATLVVQEGFGVRIKYTRQLALMPDR